MSLASTPGAPTFKAAFSLVVYESGLAMGASGTGSTFSVTVATLLLSPPAVRKYVNVSLPLKFVSGV